MKIRTPHPLALLTLLAFCAASSWAARRPEQPPLPNLDVRQERAIVQEVPAGKAAAVAALRGPVPGLKVDYDAVTGSPRHISAANGFLTGPEGKGKTISAASLAGFAVGDSNRVTKAFIKEHRQLFGHGPEALAQARITREDVTPHNGMRTVVWEQMVDGVPVYQASLIAHTTRRGELINLSSRFVPDPEQAAGRGTPNRAELLAVAGIPVREAVARAAQNVGEELKADTVTAAGETIAGPERRQKFTAPGLKGESEASLIWLPMDKDTLRLCWDVLLMSGRRGEMFRVLLDARTGEVLVRQCLTYYADASYRVFTSDSPTPFSPGHATPLTNQPPIVVRTLVTWPALDTNASPAGWIPDGGNETLGNNVDAHTDRNADDFPDLPRPQGSPFRVFDFPMNLNAQDPTSYMPAAVVQLFYLCNWYHDRMYQLGFTEAAGNFQNNNFGRGGLGNDAVQADAQDGSGTDNANFSTPPDGSPGRMQMYIFTGPNPRRDGDLDAEIVLHEYTHGLSWRLVGGGQGLGTEQSDGLGEGWSDFYGLALLSEAGDDVNGCYAAGGYASHLIGGPADAQNYYFGIRRYPYSTDLARNPLTFNDIDPAQADNCSSGAPYHTTLFGACSASDAAEVHNQGEVWCMMLWEARAGLVSKHGWTVGNQLILQLVTDGMKLTSPAPNFVQARDAILQADLVNNGGANLAELWAAFARRGLGFSATSPNGSTTSGIHEAFDLPDDLRITPNVGFTSRGPVGGPFDLTSLTFVLTNAGSNSFTWTLVNTSAWLQVSLSGGTLIPGGAAAPVTASLDSSVSSLPMGIYTATVWFTNLVSGAGQDRIFRLRVGQPDFFTELFAAGDNDLAFKTFTFTPDGSAGFYTACLEAATNFPTDPDGGTTVSLGDDEYAQVTLSGTNTVAIYQRRAGVFFIGSNGYLTFDAGDSEYEESFLDHFDRPRISALFDDLNPEGGGTISWKQLDDRVAVTCLDVPEYDTYEHLNSYQIEMFFDGRIRLTYLQIGITDGLVGLSAGQGIPVGFYESEFSGFAECLPPDGLVVTPDAGLVMQGYEGGPFTPTNVTYTLRNAGSNALNWAASITQPWLSISATNGALAVAASTSFTLSLNAQAGLLAPGLYTDVATFLNLGTGVTQTRQVSLRVKAIPGEIVVLDSIPPTTDLQMPFGPVFTGASRAEHLTVTNTDATHGLVISDLSFGSFSEDFNDGLAQDWVEISDPYWLVIAGEYRAQADSTDERMQSVFTGQRWQDNAAQVEMRRTGDLGSAARILLRASDDFDGPGGTGSAYAFAISGDGSYYVGKHLNGTFTFLQDWTASPLLNAGATTNTVLASIQGNNLRVYLNGGLAWSGTDASITNEGRIGLLAYSGSDSETVHFFDNVLVSDPVTGVAAVSPQQQHCNEHPLAGGSTEKTPPVPALDEGSAGGDVRILSLISGPWRLENVPALPFTVPPGGSLMFDVLYQPGVVGSNHAKVGIKSNDDDEPRVEVQLTGLGILDYLQVTPETDFATRGHPGGPFSPGSTNYLLANLGPASIAWAAVNMPAWVSVSPADGTLAVSNSVSVTVGLTEAANALAEGTHSGVVTFSNRTTAAVQQRNVSLTVFTSPQMVVTPASMSVTNVLGGSTNQMLQVSNALAADGQLTFHLIARETGRSILSLAAAGIGLPPAGHDFTRVGARPHRPDRVLARFAAGMAKAQRAQLMNALGGAQIVREYQLVPGLCLVKLPPGQALAQALQLLNQTPGVLYAEPDYLVQAIATIPNDSLFSQLWGMNNTGQTGGTAGADIDAPEAWDLSTGNRQVVVAVVDTGVDYTHRDLVNNIWTNPGEIPGNGLDDDHNGLVDDVHGYDFANDDGDPMDDHGHGTHCSGTIGAEGNNGLGVAGVCWKVRIMGVKFLDASGSGSTADAISSVEYATQMGAKVMNSSWGGGEYEQSLKDAIDAAGAAGVVFVAAAGNDGGNNDTGPFYPSTYTSSNLVSVMSVDHNDVRSRFSNYGQTSVDLGAPGSSILSCEPGGGFRMMSGTSMAAPHVSGACALLLSANPMLSIADLKQALLTTVEPTLAGQCVSGGRLNLARALAGVGATWISLTPGGATNIAPGVAANVTVGFHAGDMEAGTYSGEIVIVGNDVINPVVTIPVTMTIRPEDLLILPPGSFTTSGGRAGRLPQPRPSAF